MKSSSDSRHLQESILSVVRYFDFFDYPVSFDQIFTFLPVLISEARLRDCLQIMVDKGVLIKSNTQDAQGNKSKHKYAVQGHGILFEKTEKRAKISEVKLRTIKKVVSILKLFPQIQLIGLSGSCAMNNAEVEDDIDIFIIASQGRLWTARAICLIVSTLFGRRRAFNETQPRDKVCFNLFFDKDYLQVQYFKQNIYTAHEIVQMRPLYVRIRAGVYEKFMKANFWVKKYFPNVTIPSSEKTKEDNTFRGVNIVGSFFEGLLASIQKLIVSQHQTTEHLTAHQLWFFPEDFQRNIECSEGISIK